MTYIVPNVREYMLNPLEKDSSFKIGPIGANIFNLTPQMRDKLTYINGRNISEYNPEIFMLNGDFEMDDHSDDDVTNDEELNVAKLSTICDEIFNIMNGELILAEDKDEHFDNYLETCANSIQYVLGLMTDDSSWKFDPLEKFTWIYLSYACLIEPRAIKYVTCSPYYKDELFFMEDCGNITPFLILLLNKNMDIEHSKFLLTYDNLVKTYSNIPFFVYCVFNMELFKNVINIDGLVDYIIMNNYEHLLINMACKYNANVAIYLFDNIEFNGDKINLEVSDFSYLSMASLFNPSLLSYLLELKYVTSKIFNAKYTYGNILTIACRNGNMSNVELILSHKYMTEELFRHLYHLVYSKNILFACREYCDIFRLIFNHKYTNDQTVNFKSGINSSRTLFNELVHEKNYECIEIFLNSDKLKKNHMLDLDLLGKSPLLYAVYNDEKMTDMIIKSRVFDESFLRILCDNGRNILMLILMNENFAVEFKTNVILMMLQKGYLTNELLLTYDNYNITLLEYIYYFLPDITNVLLTQDSLTTIIPNTIQPIFYRIIEHTTRISLIKHMLNNAIDNIFNYNTIDGDNIFLYMAKYSFKCLYCIMENKNFNERIFNSKSSNGDNIMTILSQADTIIKKIIINEMINNRYMTKEIFNYINRDGNHSLMYLLNDDLLISTITEHKLFDPNIILIMNKHGTNCLIELSNNNKLTMDIVNVLFNENINQVDDNDVLFLAKCVKDNQVLLKYILGHYKCDKIFFMKLYENYLDVNDCYDVSILLMFLNHAFMDEYILTFVNNNRQNMLMLLVSCNEYNTRGLTDGINRIICMDSNHIIARQMDIYLHTFLFYVHDNTMLKIILNNEKFDNSVLYIQNNNGDDLVRYLYINKKYDMLITLLYYIDDDDTICDILTRRLENNQYIVVLILMTSSILFECLLKLKSIEKEHFLIIENTCKYSCLHTFSYSMADISRTIEYYKMDSLMKIFLKSDKCSSELLLLKTFNGHTFLHLMPEYTEVILESPYCSWELIMSRDDTGMSIVDIIHQSIFGNGILLKLLNSEYVPKTILLGERNILNNSGKSKPGIFLQILDSNKCDDICINQVDNNGETILFKLVASLNLSCLKLLLDSNYDLTDSFSYMYHEKSILSYGLFCSSAIFEYLLNCKYMDKNIIMMGDKYRHNILIDILGYDDSTLNIFMTSKFWLPSMLSYCDVDGDTFLMHAHKDVKNVRYILGHPDFTSRRSEILKKQNKRGMNVLHYYALRSPECLFELLNKKHYYDSIFNELDDCGNTFLHYLCTTSDNNALKCMKRIFKMKKDYSLLIQNLSNKNAIMVAIENNNDMIIDEIFKHITRDMLSKTDCNDNNLVYYLLKYAPMHLTDKIIDMLDSDLLQKENHKMKNIYHYASKYSPGHLKKLLDHPHFNSIMLFNGHLDHGSCLITASKYQPESVRHILNCRDLYWKVLNARYKDKTFIHYGSEYNYRSVVVALEMKYQDIKELFEMGTDTPVLLASKYQPKLIEYLLQNNVELIINEIKRSGRKILDYGYNYQPVILKYLIESNKFLINFLDSEDEVGYRLSNKLNRIFGISSLDNIGKVPLINHENIKINKYSDMTCNICYSYKSQVIFLPCFHSCCIGCSFKLCKCHHCRATIEDRKIPYMLLEN